MDSHRICCNDLALVLSNPFPRAVEVLNCKRPSNVCMASSKILTPPPPHRPATVFTPPPLVRGEDTLDGVRGGGGSIILEDARHCSVFYICKYFVPRVLALLPGLGNAISMPKFHKKSERKMSLNVLNHLMLATNCSEYTVCKIYILYTV